MSGTANATWLMPTTPRLGLWFWAMDVAVMPTSVPATNRARPRMSSSCFGGSTVARMGAQATSGTATPSVLRRPLHRDGVTDVDRHQVLAEHERPGIGLARRRD